MGGTHCPTVARCDFLFYYRHLICDEILQLAPAGAFNLHGSLLPKYRGRAPLNWVLVNGETETGVTLHRMVKRADAGPLWRNCALPLRQTISLLRCIINCAMPRASYWNRHYPPLNTVIFWKSPSAKTKPPVLVAERRMTVSLNGINRHPYCTTWYVPLPIRGGCLQLCWQSEIHRLVVACSSSCQQSTAGSVISVAPLLIACGDGALEIVTGQAGDGITMQGSQLAQTLGTVQGSRLNSQPACTARRRTRTHPRGEWLYWQPSDRTPAARRSL